MRSARRIRQVRSGCSAPSPTRPTTVHRSPKPCGKAKRKTASGATRPRRGPSYTSDGARVFPAELSCFLVDYYREKGVDMRVGAGMAGMEEREGACVVRPTTGGELRADVVVAGLGILPEVELAAQAGLAVANGVTVDEVFRTRHPAVYAAGGRAHLPPPAPRATLPRQDQDKPQ